MKRAYLFFLPLCVSMVFVTYAANPPTPFSPQDNILDPNCLPSDTNCYIKQDNQVFTNATATTLYASALSALSSYFSGNVGVGTLDPIWKLHVQGNDGDYNGLLISGDDLKIKFANASNTLQRLVIGYNATDNSGYLGPLGSTYIYGNNNNLVLNTTGSNHPVLMQVGPYTGKVGIGTTSPVSTLSIQGADGLNPFIVASSTGSTLFTILQNGNVGIGATNPSSKLSIQGNDSVVQAMIQNTNETSTTTYARFLVSNSDGAIAMERYSAGYVGTGARQPRAGVITNSGTGGLSIAASNEAMRFYTSNSGGLASTDERMRITAFGNVGIGTTSPTASLAITGRAGVNPFSIASSTGSSLFTILENGNVGIGTTSPLTKLHVVTNDNNMMLIEQSVSGQGASLNFKANNENSAYLAYFPTNYPDSNFVGSAVLTSSAINGSVMMRASDPTGVLKFFTGGSALIHERMRITSNGNVGIGTSTPSSKLDVYSATSTSNVDVIRLLSDVGGSGNVKFRIDSDGDIFTDGGTTIGNPADVAENYSSTEVLLPGTVVALASTTSEWNLNEDGQASTTYLMSQVRTAHNGDTTFGIVSTRPGILLGGNTANGVPIALSGRVPVKVTNENGEVTRGDYLVLSTSTPGYAMKMTENGKSLGRALSDSQGNTGTVLVFIDNKYHLITLNGLEGLSTFSTFPTTPPATVSSMITDALRKGIDVTSSFVSVKLSAVIAYIDTLFVKDIHADTIETKIITTGDIHTQNKICIGDTCVTENQLKNLLNQNGSQVQVVEPTSIPPTVDTTSTTTTEGTNIPSETGTTTESLIVP